MSNPFDVLGIPRDAPEDQIKTAYRKLAREHHPDLNRDADEPTRKASEDKLKEINAAYETLKDPQKRARAAAGDTGGQGFDPFAGGGFSFHSFHDMFEQHFRQQRPVNRDIMAQVRLTLEEAFTGKTIDIEVQAPQGRRTIQVTVPAGVDEGQRLRVVGEGEKVHANLPPGNLYVTVLLAPHATFQRFRENLLMVSAVNGFDAMLGTTIEISTVDGSRVRVDVPPGVQPDDRLRVRGQGMPVVGTERRGDLILQVKVQTPTDLTDAQRDLIRRAALRPETAEAAAKEAIREKASDQNSSNENG